MRNEQVFNVLGGSPDDPEMVAPWEVVQHADAPKQPRKNRPLCFRISLKDALDERVLGLHAKPVRYPPPRALFP